MRLVALTPLVVAAALAVAAPADASCFEPSPADRPDVVQAFQWHVVYAVASDTSDRYEEWGPRIARDQAEIDAWFRAQDPTRTPRYDLAELPGCDGFDALDVSFVRLPHESGHYVAGTFWRIRESLRELGLERFEKRYLVYYDGPSVDHYCGYGGAYALVYIANCPQDGFRQAVALHEMLHVLGARHVTDPTDVMHERIEPLWQMTLDVGRDEYYGHTRAARDVRTSLFLRRLDVSDQTPPAPPSVTATQAPDQSRAPTAIVSWSLAADDGGPPTYQVVARVVVRSPDRPGSGDPAPTVHETAGSALTDENVLPGETVEYSVFAVDAAGNVSVPARIRFKLGYGVVDDAGTLIRDTVAPPQVTPPLGVEAAGRARLTIRWPLVLDAGGMRGYRVRVGGRRFFVTQPVITLPRRLVRGRPLRVAAVDRSGNVGRETAFRIAAPR